MCLLNVKATGYNIGTLAKRTYSLSWYHATSIDWIETKEERKLTFKQPNTCKL